MALKGLIIDQPWIGMILRGEKTWEMRSRGTSVRGQIALIEKGTGTIVGLATLANSLPALTPSEMAPQSANHCIPPQKFEEQGFKWFTPWVLTDVRRLNAPIRYAHPSGAVTWVNLSAQEETAVLGSSQQRNHLSTATMRTPRSPVELVDSDVRFLADRAVSQISEEAGLSIPANVSRKIRRRGNKVYIDVEWDDGSPARHSRKLSGLVDLIGNLGVAAACFCMLAFTIHVPLAMLSSSFTLFGAFKWLLAGFVFMILAVVGGRGDSLNEIFGSR